MQQPTQEAAHRTNGSSAAERPPFGGLTEGEIEDLVERVSQKVMTSFYEKVGQTVVAKVIWIIGIATVGLVIWLGGSGKMKIFP